MFKWPFPSEQVSILNWSWLVLSHVAQQVDRPYMAQRSEKNSDLHFPRERVANRRCSFPLTNWNVLLLNFVRSKIDLNFVCAMFDRSDCPFHHLDRWARPAAARRPPPLCDLTTDLFAHRIVRSDLPVIRSASRLFSGSRERFDKWDPRCPDAPYACEINRSISSWSLFYILNNKCRNSLFDFRCSFPADHST